MSFIPALRHAYKAAVKDGAPQNGAIGNKIRLYNIPLAAKPSDIRAALTRITNDPSPVDVQLEYFSFLPVGNAIVTMRSEEHTRKLFPKLKNLSVGGMQIRARLLAGMEGTFPKPSFSQLKGMGTHAGLPRNASTILIENLPPGMKEFQLNTLLSEYNVKRNPDGTCIAKSIEFPSFPPVPSKIGVRIVQLASEDDAYRAARDLHNSNLGGFDAGRKISVRVVQ